MPERKRSNTGNMRARIFQEGIDCHSRKAVVSFTKVDEIKVNHLFLDEILCWGCQDHLREHPGSIYTSSGIVDDSFDDLLANVCFALIIENVFEIVFQFVEFIFFIAFEIDFLTIFLTCFLLHRLLWFDDIHFLFCLIAFENWGFVSSIRIYMFFLEVWCYY